MENRNWHDRNYKKLLIIPLLLFLFSVGYLIYFHQTTGDFIRKDISLTGGTTATVYENIDISKATVDLEGKLPELNVREISDLQTGKQTAVIFETTLSGEETKKILEDYVGHELVEGKNLDIEFTGSSLSSSFYKQLLIAILISFLLMALVVFLMFKDFTPSSMVVLCAFGDILMTLVTFNLLGLKMSTAGIVAFLMLIGYSVDTDILLTTRLLKRSNGTINQRILSSVKTGMTMTLTSFFAFVCAFFMVRSFSPVLTQIFTILIIGLLFDIFNTWLTNVSLLKWHMEAKGLK